MNNNTIEMKQAPYSDLIAMNEPHLPLILLLDCSGSMKGRPLEELLEGYNNFISQTAQDDLAAKRVDLAVMSFSGSGIQPIMDFTPLSQSAEMSPLSLKAEGCTPMGEAIVKGIRMLRDRCRIYDEAGIAHFGGWLVMLTDGQPSDDLTAATDLIRQREEAGRLKFFSIAVNNANVEILQSLGKRVIQSTAQDNFKGIFNWMSESMVIVSASRVSDNPQLPPLPEDFRIIPSDW